MVRSVQKHTSNVHAEYEVPFFGGNIIADFIRQIGIQNSRIIDTFTFLHPCLAPF